MSPDGSWLATTGRRGASRSRKRYEGSWTVDPATGVTEPYGVPGDPVVRTWDSKTGRERFALDTGDARGVGRILASPVGDWLATTTRDDPPWRDRSVQPGDPVVRIWDLTSGVLRHAVDTGHTTGVGLMVAGPAGDWIATGGEDDSTVRIWDTADGTMRHALETGHARGVSHLAADPRGGWLATAGKGARSGGDADPVVRIWDTATGQLRATLRTGHLAGIGHLTAFPDERLITVSHGYLQLFAVDGEALAAMRVDGDIRQCVGLPDATGIAVAGSHGLFVFDLRRPGELPGSGRTA
jgi:WD40 repeat protein